MKVYVDASTQGNKNGVGIIVISHNKIINRTGFRFKGLTSLDAEKRAIKIGLIEAKRYMADDIYSDCQHLKSEFKEKVKFINRKFNSYADGLAKLEAERFPWREEYQYRLSVQPLSDPMEWRVVSDEDHIVHIHNKRFYCSCDKSNILLKRKVPCRHVLAVWRKINFMNKEIEGIF